MPLSFVRYCMQLLVACCVHTDRGHSAFFRWPVSILSTGAPSSSPPLSLCVCVYGIAICLSVHHFNATAPLLHACVCVCVFCPSDTDNDEEEEEEFRAFRPGIDSLNDDEELDYDASAYRMLHRFTLEWPALSFDVVRDTLGTTPLQNGTALFCVSLRISNSVIVIFIFNSYYYYYQYH